MRSIDTETTGLWWQDGTTTYSIGTMDEDEKFRVWEFQIDPKTRQRVNPPSDRCLQIFRDYHATEETVYQNAKFDVKAQCEMGVFDWQEPSDPSFWTNITELGFLTHLYDSTLAKWKSSLKLLAPKFLGVDYQSEKELHRLAGRCRSFVKTRQPDWKQANSQTVPQGVKDWVKMDMWLLSAVYNLYPLGRVPTPAELQQYYTDGRGVSQTVLQHQHEARAYFRNGTPDTAAFDDDWEALNISSRMYLRDDCKYTLALAIGFGNELVTDHEVEELQSWIRMNTDIQHVVWKMEVLGVGVNKQSIDNAINVCEEQSRILAKRCQAIAGRDFQDTDAKVRAYLFDELGLEPVAMTKGGKSGRDRKPSVNADSLLELKEQCEELSECRASGMTSAPENEYDDANRFLSTLLAWRKYDKKRQALEGYQRQAVAQSVVPYPVSAQHSLFPSFKEAGTGTTRFTANNPSTQTIEKANNPFEDEYDDIAEMLMLAPMTRSIFCPAEGYWWFPIDYSQLQLRIFAAATEDPALIQSFRDGHDFHDFMARVIFDLPDSVKPTAAQRRIAKNTNFGFIFGASSKKIDAVAKRKGLYAYLMTCFPGAHNFIRQTKELIKETGIVYTLGGYPLHIPVQHNHWGSGYAAHMGVNYVVQGTEGEIVKYAMRTCDDYLTENFSTPARSAIENSCVRWVTRASGASALTGHEAHLQRIADDDYYHRIMSTPSPKLDKSSANYLRQEISAGRMEQQVLDQMMKVCDARMVMQVHDELVFQLPACPDKKHVRRLCQLMEEAGEKFGVETPVDPEVTRKRLDRKAPVILSS